MSDFRPIYRVLGLAIIALAARAENAPSAVLVELFTSEGCSSCPPADQLLQVLEREQPVPGVRVIALGHHVDYWNRLGWTDPYSLPECTNRQQRYSEVFRKDGVYTPQMVVDGRTEFVGSDTRKAAAAIAAAAREPKADVQIVRTPDGGIRVNVSNVPGSSSREPAEVLLAIAETNLASSVTRGENKGRRLTHTAVVRRVSALGQVRSGSFETEVPAAPLNPDWRRENLRAVVFVQERGSRRVLGAAFSPL